RILVGVGGVVSGVPQKHDIGNTGFLEQSPDMLPGADEAVINQGRRGAPGVAAASLVVAEVVELPEPAQQDRSRVLLQRVRRSRDNGVLVGGAAGNHAVGVGHALVAGPRDYRYAPV